MFCEQGSLDQYEIEGETQAWLLFFSSNIWKMYLVHYLIQNILVW